MSSPARSPHWLGPVEQRSGEGENNGFEEEGVTVKPMRLKVLYTFDDQNKTNCLARWPHVLQIRTVSMEETVSIGVIELKTCIQAIVQCSPELVARLGQDYTIYAYDYSEYDTPLVGQGMLSWALAASSPTPDAPAHQSRQLITGRVCKNIQGLFSNGVKETLEVKLRLVPVPTVLQSEYLNSMEKYRELSRFMPSGFDHNEWFTFLQSNPNIAQLANKAHTPTPPTYNRDGISMEVVNRLLSPSLSQQPSLDSFNNLEPNENNGVDSRASTPGAGRRGGKQSRPSSRNSVKRPRKARTKSVSGAGNTSGYEEGTDGDDAPPNRKRAKTIKADWNSRSSFGAGTDSLRVAASIAGSLRLFRPIAVAPTTGAPNNHLQETPRAPTPIPSLPNQPIQRDRAPSQSGLRRDSLISQMGSQQQRYNSPYLPDDSSRDSQDQPRMSIESAMTSPEKNESPSESPADIASSPPVLRNMTPLRSSPPCPSSPVLPQMPRTDSGFMSGDLNELFGDEDETRAVDDEDIAVTKKYSRRTQRPQTQRPEIHHGFAIQEVNPGPVELLPTKMLPRVEPKQGYQQRIDRSLMARAGDITSNDAPSLSSLHTQIHDIAQTPSATVMQPTPPNAEIEQSSTTPEPTTLETQQVSNRQVYAPSLPPPPARMMSRTASAGSLTLPTITASDPVLPPSNLHRSQTWSEAPHPTTDHEPSTSTYNVTKGTLAKKNAIRMRLENAIVNGEMPPFCCNCGAIDTPTWRKAWARECKGDPGYHEYSDEPGKVMAIDRLEKDDDGKPTSYRMIKKSLLPSEDKTGFSEILMCNPCGIWMSKYKTQRPEDKWRKEYKDKAGRDSSQPAEKKKRTSRGRKVQNGNQSVANREACLQSDAPVFSDGYHLSTNYDPQADASWMSQFQQTVIEGTVENLEQPDLPAPRLRASSMQPAKKINAMTSDTASAALKRAIRSSPARWLGTQHSPIELEDEDFGTTRRVLFPSPRKDGSPKVLGEVMANTVQQIPLFQSPTRIKNQLARSSDKENCPPMSSLEESGDRIVKLIGEILPKAARPTTPERGSPHAHPFKTPTRPTPSHRPVTRSQSRSARSARHQMMPQRTPSRTPTSVRRRSPRNHPGVLESPFTATLNRLLSEGNEDGHNQSPSRHLDLGIDFSLPELGHSTMEMHTDPISWGAPHLDATHDFYSTDVPMPSSPPKLFDLYEDPMTMGMGVGLEAHMWSDFPMEHMDSHNLGELVVDADGHASFAMGNQETQLEAGIATNLEKVREE